MKLQHLAFIGLSMLLLFTCSKNEHLPLDKELPQNEDLIIESAESRTGKKGRCCEETSLSSVELSHPRHGTCCLYEFTFQKGNGKCDYILPRGIIYQNNFFENDNVIIWQTEVCVDEEGDCNSQDVKVYASDYSTQTSYVCANTSIYTNCDCDYTFDQGVSVGCSAAENNNCNTNSSAYKNTIRDFECMCPEYIAGFMAGWNTYCESGSCGECTDPQPDPTCECVDGEWDCI